MPLERLYLVFFGILIALQINNWNVERINRLEEKAYLNRLVENLERDIINIMAVSERHQQRLIVGVKVLDSLISKNEEDIKPRKDYTQTLKKYSADQIWIPRTMGQMFNSTLRIIIFYKSDIAFQELLSTGKIDIIKNSELKAAIQEHYLKLTENQNFQDQIAMTIQVNYREVLNKNYISMISKESYSELQDKFVDPQGLIVALENYLAISETIMSMFVYDDNSIKNATESLISQIRKELANAK